MFERLIYEARPFLYLGGAVGAHKFNHSSFTTASAVLLSVCVALILYWRYEYRTRPVRRRP